MFLQMLAHTASHTVNPDQETASNDYARRFEGEIGEYLLQKQKTIVSAYLQNNSRPLRILDVGGGHCQLTSLLLQLGHEIWIQGSNENSLFRARSFGKKVRCVISPLQALPFPASSFDIVFAFRLLPHVIDWKLFLSEICRVARTQVIFDYASLIGPNILTPLLFQTKKWIEGNTRPYFCHSFLQLKNYLEQIGFGQIEVKKQFFLPMGLHRLLNSVSVSDQMEGICERLRLTALFGSPGIVSATYKTTQHSS